VFFPWDSDDVLGQKIAELEGADCYQPPLVMEGGSFDVDGQGTALTTAECLLDPNRNPELPGTRSRDISAGTSAWRRWCGYRAASTSTRPTGTSTTWRGS
jgi:hypothetical protein